MVVWYIGIALLVLIPVGITIFLLRGLDKDE